MYWWYLLLCEDAVCNLINSIVEEGKFCTDIMKKPFKKEILTNKETNKDFENSTKYWICDNSYVYVDVKVRDHCHCQCHWKI